MRLSPRLPISTAARRIAVRHNRLLEERGPTGQACEYTPEGRLSLIWNEGYTGQFTPGSLVVPLRNRITPREAHRMADEAERAHRRATPGAAADVLAGEGER